MNFSLLFFKLAYHFEPLKKLQHIEGIVSVDDPAESFSYCTRFDRFDTNDDSLRTV